MATLKERLQNPDYKAWIKTSICLGFTKVGLEVFAAENSKTFHKNVLDQLRIKGNPNSSQVCSQATVRSGRATCCSNCQDFIDEIDRQNMKSFRFRQENWDNSNMQLWPNYPWEMAKVFMNRGQKPIQRSPGDTDLSGILNFLDHCIVAKNKITHNGNISKVRDSRNSVMHSASMTLPQKDFTDFATYMIDLLEDPGVLSKSLKAQEAAIKVREVMTTDFHITTEDEIRILAEKLEHLENEIMSMKTENTEIQKKIKENTEILKGIEIKTIDNKSELIASVEEMHRRENVVRCSIAALYKLIENAADIREQMQNSLTKLDERFKSEISLIHGRLTNLEFQMSGLQALECTQNILESESSEDFTKDTRELKKCLIEEYKRFGFNIPLSPINEGINDNGWKINVDEIYVDLKIVESEKSFPLKTYKDIFYAKERRNRIIVLKGEAGVGKSTWCMNLLAAWVRTQDKAEKSIDQPTNILSECIIQDLEESLSQFEFLFYIPLRYLKDKKSVKEAILSSTLQGLSDFNGTVQKIIESCSDKVLILLDGLDEYSVNLSYDELNRCTVITTTRPWKYDLFLSTNPELKVDLVLKLEGLDERGTQTLAHKLCRALNISIDDEDVSTSRNSKKGAFSMGVQHQVEQELEIVCLYEDLLTWRNSAKEAFSMGVQNLVKQFFKCVRNVGLENCLKVPLTLIIMLETFLENHSLADRKTDILISLLETLVERGETKLSDLGSIPSNENTLGPFTETNVLSPYSDLLRKLSKLAFESIVSSEKEHSLIFSENQIKQYLNDGELDVCLKFGLISKSRHLMLCNKPKISFSFYHKLIQEFFAAVWIVSNKEAENTIKNFVTCIPDVLEMDNVFVFICGLDAYIGSEMTKHFISLCNKDEDILYYRSFGLPDSFFRDTEHPVLSNLTKMLLEGQREIKDSGTKVSLIGSDIVVFRMFELYSERDLLEILTGSVDCLKSVGIFFSNASGGTSHKILETVQKAVGLQNLIFCRDYFSIEINFDLNLENCTELQIVNINYLKLPAIRTGNLQNLTIIAFENIDMPSAIWEPLFDQIEKQRHLCCLKLKSCRGVERKRVLNLENCFQLEKLQTEGVTIQIGVPRNLAYVWLENMEYSSWKLLVDQLGKQSNLTFLTLRGSCIHNKEIDLNLENCNQIKRLDIRSLRVRAIHIGVQSKLNFLTLIDIDSLERDLNLENCIQIKTIFIQRLNVPGIQIGERTNLSEVHLSDVNMSSSGWKQFFDQLEKQNNLSDLKLSRLYEVGRHLDLSKSYRHHNIPLRGIKVPAIRFGVLSNLTELKLEAIGSFESSINFENCIQLKNLSMEVLDTPAIRLGERTKLTNLNLSDVKISSLGGKLLFDELETQSNLRHLSLKGIGSVERDLNLENCIKLEELSIKGLSVPAIRIRVLSKLCSLYLENIGIVERDLNLENCIRLQNFRMNLLDAPAIQNGERTNLANPDLSDVEMSPPGWKLLFDQLGKKIILRSLELKGWGSVESGLNLENCILLKHIFINVLDVPMIRIGKSSYLEKFDLSDVKMSSSGWKLLFDDLEKQIFLKSFSLKGPCSVETDLNLGTKNSLNKIFIHVLDASMIQIGERTKLRILDLSDVKMSSSSWKLLFDQLESQSNLSDLSLGGIGSVDRDLNLKNCIDLRILSIAGLNVPAIRIDGLEKLREIKIVDVQMSSSGWKLLFDQLEKHNSLSDLSLGGIGSVERDLNLKNCIDLRILSIAGLNVPAIRIDGLEKLREIKIVDVQMSSSGWKLLFDQLEKHNSLSDLSLGGIGSVERDLNLKNCIDLRILSIAGLNVPAIRIDGLENIREIKIVDVQMFSSGWKLLIDQLEKNSKLSDLSLGGIGIVEMGLNLKNCIHLRILSIAGLNVPAIRIDGLENLFEIKIVDIQMSSSGWEQLFDQLEKHSYLSNISFRDIVCVERDLNLKNCILLNILSIAGLNVPAIRIDGLKTLREIKIVDVQMSSSGWKLLIDQLEKNSKLSDLSLGGIGSVDRDLNLKNCIDLRILSIAGLNVPAIRIDGLEKLREIKIVDVQMSSSGWKLLFDQLEKHNSLSDLSLGGIGSVDRDLNLKNCIDLRILSIAGLNVPAIRIDGLEKLREIKIVDVQMSSSGWKLLFDQLEKHNSLSDLSLGGIGSVERDLNLKNCIDLRILSIAGLNVPAIRIDGLENIREIKIVDVQMFSSGWKLLIDQLEKNSKLSDLSLGGIGIVEMGLNLKNCIHLRILSIAGLNVPAIRIDGLENLFEIKIVDIQMSSSGWEQLFDQLEKHSYLSNISFRDIVCVERDLNLKNCIFLNILSIAGLNVPAIRIDGLKTLREIKIVDVQMSSSGWKLLIDQLEKNSKLSDLSLGGIGSVDRDLNLKNCIDLRILSIAGLNVPAIRIDGLEKLREIKIVDVQMSSSGWKLLFDQLEKHNRLSDLSLGGIGSVERDLNLKNCIDLRILSIAGLNFPAIRIDGLENICEIKIVDIQMSSSGWEQLFDQLEKHSYLSYISFRDIARVGRDLNLENCILLNILSIAGLNVPAIRIDGLKSLREIKIVDVQMSSSGWKLLFDQLEKNSKLSDLSLGGIGSVDRDLNLKNCIDLRILSIAGLNVPAIRIDGLEKLREIKIVDVQMSYSGLELLFDQLEKQANLSDLSLGGISVKKGI